VSKRFKIILSFPGCCVLSEKFVATVQLLCELMPTADFIVVMKNMNIIYIIADMGAELELRF
jgi:hypothetical protein